MRSNVMTDTGKHFAEMRGGVLSAISTLSVLWIERPFSRKKGLSNQPQPRRGAGATALRKARNTRCSQAAESFRGDDRASQSAESPASCKGAYCRAQTLRCASTKRAGKIPRPINFITPLRFCLPPGGRISPRRFRASYTLRFCPPHSSGIPLRNPHISASCALPYDP